MRADEVFVTNARVGVVPVRRVGEHSIRMTDLAHGLRSAHRDARCVNCCSSSLRSWSSPRRGGSYLLAARRRRHARARSARAARRTRGETRRHACARCSPSSIRAARSPTGAPSSCELRVRGWPQVRTGRYEIPAHASPAEILRQLAEGRVVLESLTVIEGWTFADMRRAVEAHPRMKATLERQDVAGVMAAIGHAGRAPGRALLSRTRIGSRRAPPTANCLALAYRKMAEALDAAWNSRAADAADRTTPTRR